MLWRHVLTSLGNVWPSALSLWYFLSRRWLGRISSFKYRDLKSCNTRSNYTFEKVLGRGSQRVGWWKTRLKILKLQFIYWNYDIYSDIPPSLLGPLTLTKMHLAYDERLLKSRDWVCFQDSFFSLLLSLIDNLVSKFCDLAERWFPAIVKSTVVSLRNLCILVDPDSWCNKDWSDAVLNWKLSSESNRAFLAVCSQRLRNFTKNRGLYYFQKLIFS